MLEILKYVNATTIYCGATGETLEKRKQQYIETDSRFVGMNILPVYYTTQTSHALLLLIPFAQGFCVRLPFCLGL